VKNGKSVNERKRRALDTISQFEGIPPRPLLATLAGVHRNTFLDWGKDDEQFSDELTDILNEKRLKKARELYKGFDKCVGDGHYPAIKDGLRVIDPETWAAPEENKGLSVNIMYLDIGPGRGANKGKGPKRITNGRHRLK